ncbi:MAG: hypothetical protein ABIF12_00290, partial [bacterium]
PFWAFLAMFVYYYYIKKSTDLVKSFINAFIYSTPFFGVLILYVFFRIFFISLNFSTSSGFWKSFLFRNRLADFYTLVANLTNQSIYFLPGGNFKLKSFLAILFFTIILFLFFRCNKKKYFIFLMISFFMFLWPAVFGQYVNRYLYTALPFYLLAILFSVTFFERKNYLFNKVFQKIIIFIFSILLVFNFLILFKALKERELFLFQRKNALNELVSNDFLKKKNLVFIALPQRVFCNSLAQELWIMGFNTDFSIYYDDRTFVAIPKYIKKINNPIILIKRNKIFLTLDEKDNCFFEYNLSSSKIGTIEPLDGKVEQIKSIRIILEDKYLNEDLIFVTWDYENNKFKILNEKPL